MSVEVELNDELVNEAKMMAEISNRTVDEQIDRWICLGKMFENSLSEKELEEFLKHPESFQIIVSLEQPK